MKFFSYCDFFKNEKILSSILALQISNEIYILSDLNPHRNYIFAYLKTRKLCIKSQTIKEMVRFDSKNSAAEIT